MARNAIVTKSSTGNRYSKEKQAMILAWYKTRAKHNPYGAIQATMNHYNVSYVALKRWIDREKGLDPNKKKSNRPLVKAFRDLVKVETKRVSVMQRIIQALE